MDSIDFSNINAFDGDGHVEEWEETWSDRYLDPEFRDRRPVVVEYFHVYRPLSSQLTQV